MVTWSEFVLLVNVKIAESSNNKEPEIEYINLSLTVDLSDITVTINKDNRLEIS